MREQRLAARGHLELRRRPRRGLAGGGLEPHQSLVDDGGLPPFHDEVHLAAHAGGGERRGRRENARQNEKSFHLN